MSDKFYLAQAEVAIATRTILVAYVTTTGKLPANVDLGLLNIGRVLTVAELDNLKTWCNVTEV